MGKSPHFSFDEIPPDREDGRSSLVHSALIFTGKLGTLPPGYLLPLWIGMAVWVGWLWGSSLWGAAAVGFVLLLAADWALLAWLPRTQRSWGPTTPSLLGLAIVHCLLFTLGALVAKNTIGLGLTTLTNVALTGIAFYATWIEPFEIQVTHQTLTVEPWGRNTLVRLLHISDIHFERLSFREKRLLELVDELQPDLIVVTGDYLNLSSVYDPEAQAGTREVLACFHAPAGVYAVTGSPVVDVPSLVPDIFQGLAIRWLDDEAVPIEVKRESLYLLGIRNTYDEARDTAALKALASATPADAFRLLLYHTPDLMPVATEEGIDLYLCGHTHGGQIRLPIYGAIATSSRWGKRYEQGRYEERRTTLYVSRGLGVEGLGAPRARFLAPPEVILWELRGPN